LGVWISPKTWIGGLSCMHEGQKRIQIPWDHQKIILFLEKYKECAICAILREKTSFWGIHRGWKRCCAWSGALKMLPRGTKKMQIPRSYQKKCLLCRKPAISSVRWKFHVWEAWGGSPPKSAHFGALTQHRSTSDSVKAPKKIILALFLYNFAILRNATLFRAWISPKTWIGGLGCMHKGQKCIQILWDHHKKNCFFENYKECAICPFLSEKTSFWGIHRG